MTNGMRRSVILGMVLHLIFVCIPGYPQDRKKEDKILYLTTVDIQQPYKIIKLVSYRSSVLDPNKVIEELEKKGKKLNADYIIGVHLYSHSGYLYGTGTAVKLIKEENIPH